MKAYIHQTVEIDNLNCCESDWLDLCNSFSVFENDFTIFNTRDSRQITIRPQKIVLSEEDMSGFLSTLKEACFLYGVELNTCFRIWKYNVETERITVTLNVNAALSPDD